MSESMNKTAEAYSEYIASAYVWASLQNPSRTSPMRFATITATLEKISDEYMNRVMKMFEASNEWEALAKVLFPIMLSDKVDLKDLVDEA